MIHYSHKATELRAFIVSVDYADLLAYTLPWNMRHFRDVTIITTDRDKDTINIAKWLKCNIHITDSFYDNGAYFNKWKALEEGLDKYGRWGWIALLDADTLWPRTVDLSEIKKGYFYGPERRMINLSNKRYIHPKYDEPTYCSPDDLPDVNDQSWVTEGVKIPCKYETLLPFPRDDQWGSYPIHRNSVREFPGYTQIFYGKDPVLSETPWHQIDWIHAGGADSYFPLRWPEEKRIKLPWKVLHLGESGVNWCGRVTNYIGGSEPENSLSNAEKMQSIFRERRRNRVPDFGNERLS